MLPITLVIVTIIVIIKSFHLEKVNITFNLNANRPRGRQLKVAMHLTMAL